ncbi:MAG: MFS transporter [Pseudonocardiales bacterium]
MSPTFRSLHVRNYRLFAAGQIVSNTGTWMQRVAQDWLVLQLTHNNATALGITTGLQFLPMLLFGLWGGLIADRYPKRRLLFITQSTMGLQAILLGFLAITHTATVWHVYGLAFVLGMVTAFDNPARQSFVVEIVGKEDLPNAVGLNSATFHAARVVGPALAGLLINLVGTGPVFLINGVSYLAVLAGLFSMRETELRPADPVERGSGQLMEGLRYVRHRRDLLLPIVVVGIVGTFGMNFQMTMAIMAKSVFGKGAGAYGLLGTALAVGSLSGALLAATRARPSRRLLVGSATIFGLLEVVCGLMPSYFSFMALLVPTGVVLILLNTTANATVQMGAGARMRGRVMALYMTVLMGGTPLGAPVIGWLADVAGARWSLIGGGVISAVGTAVAALAIGGVPVRAGLRGALGLTPSRLEQVPPAGWAHPPDVSAAFSEQLIAGVAEPRQPRRRVALEVERLAPVVAEEQADLR